MPAQKWQKEDLYGGGAVEKTSKPLQDQRSEMIIVNQDTGQMQQVRYREKEYIDGRKVAWTPEYTMNNLNRTSWDEEKLRIMQWKKDMNQVQDRFDALHRQKLELLRSGEGKNILTENEKRELATLKSELRNRLRSAPKSPFAPKTAIFIFEQQSGNFYQTN